jgi:hypothetical protein
MFQCVVDLQVNEEMGVVIPNFPVARHEYTNILPFSVRRHLACVVVGLGIIPRACGCMLGLDKHSPTRNNLLTNYNTFNTPSTTVKHLQTHSTTFNVTIHLARTTINYANPTSTKDCSFITFGCE